MKQNDNFDEILQDVLGEYRDAEPLAGLEDRVLRRVQMQAVQRKRLLWRWTAFAATAAVLAIAVWVGVSTRAPKKASSATAAHGQSQPVVVPQPEPPRQAEQHGLRELSPTLAQAPLRQSRHTMHSSANVTSQRGPASPRFPSPTPLTAEERSLLLMARNDSDALRVLSAPDEQIAIAPITIKPLDDSGNEGEKQ